MFPPYKIEGNAKLFQDTFPSISLLQLFLLFHKSYLHFSVPLLPWLSSAY